MTSATDTWECCECGRLVSGEEDECEAYDKLQLQRECLVKFLRAAKLTLKPKGPNILVLDPEGHEVNL